MSQEMTCAFTGHRPNRLPWGEDMWDWRRERVKEWMEQQLARALEQGFRHFICGMARGADLLFAETVLEQKVRYPDLILEAAVPCPGQADRWSALQSERYRRILAQCDLETLVCRSYTPDCMLRRNRYMVDRSALLLAVYDGNPTGGTAKTVLYALQKGLRIEQLDPNDL